VDVEKKLEKKAEQLLKVKEIKALSDRLIELNKKKNLTPLFLLRVIMLNFAEGPEIRELRNEFEAFEESLPGPEINQKKYDPQKQEDMNELIERLRDYNKRVDTLNELTEKALDIGLQLHKEGRLIIEPAPEREEALNFLTIGSMKPYYEFTRLLSGGRFDIKEGQKWPSASFNSVNGEVYLKPLDADRKPILGDNLTHFQELMQGKVMELEKHGHLTADIFDILVNKWLKTARYPEAMVKISINDFLEVRGLKPMKRGEDRRSGYTDAQRQQIAQQIDLLDNVYITITEMDVYPKGQKKKSVRGLSGRSIIKDMEAGQMDLAGNVKADEWYLRPGTIFANYFFEPYGRQTALLSLMAVQYDPYRQKWEKSLARYLAWIWRIDEGRTREGLLVSKLLEAAGEEFNTRRASITKARLEKALDQLKDDGIIGSWEYNKKIKAAGREWWRKWLDEKIILSAPEEILQHYEQIKGKN